MNLRIEYREEMKSLQKDIVRMGAIIEKALDNVMKAMASQDDALARQTIAMDDDVDAMEASIEKRCIHLLLRQSPAAGELRDVLSILKIITDLERIGDHCEDICEWISEDQSSHVAFQRRATAEDCTEGQGDAQSDHR